MVDSLMQRLKLEFDLAEDVGSVSVVKSHLIDYVELSTSVIGNLRITAEGKLEEFSETPLVMISTSLVNSSWALTTFGTNGSEEIVTIPDHEPSVSLKIQDGAILFSVVFRGSDLCSTLCPVYEFLQIIGSFHGSISRYLVEKNPHILSIESFRHTYPGAAYISELGKLELTRN